ncbi:MAG: S8 family serine peptidase, partial [Thermoflexibacter sp.]|nr:S8 family serine peptidase [Thermoflexibacter sp.]
MLRLTFFRFTFVFIIVFACRFTLSAQEDYKLHLLNGEWSVKPNMADFIKKKSITDRQLKNKDAKQKSPIIIQFHQLPNETQRKKIKENGIELLDYLPQYAYTALIPTQLTEKQAQDLRIRAFVDLPITAKVSADLSEKIIPAYAKLEENLIGIDITLVANEGMIEVENEIKKVKGTIQEKSSFFRIITAYIPKNHIYTLAQSKWIQYISRLESPLEIQNNRVSRNRHTANILANSPRNLQGSGVIIGVWDGILRPHVDFENRVINKEDYNDLTDPNETDHGNHVAGTLAGAGNINPANQGIAPKATLFSYSFGDNNTGRVNATISVETEVLSAVNEANPSAGVVITQNSFGPSISGCAGLTNYPARARRRDILARTYPFLTQCVSAGNSQSVCSNGFTTITDVTKNAIVVGNTDALDNIAATSSFGPTRDGRIKPDIAAIGESVTSLSFDNQYSVKSGTSMATPSVSGIAALLYERFRQINNNTNPTSDLIKALICNNADDIANPLPDYKTGFGRLNGMNVIKALEENRFEKGSLNQGQVHQKSIVVLPNTAELKVMLTWIDPEAVAGTSLALVNNLDLQVIAPDGTIFNPWVLDPNVPNALATRKIDNINNIEQVTIANPIAGTYTLFINGTSIPQPSQDYALTWSINPFYREITYPQAGDILRPNITQTVYWQQAGASGVQTVEYSLDGGINWVIIGTVNTPATAINWLTPNINPNNQVRVRVSGGFAPNIVTETPNFNIVRTPANFNITGCGTVQLSWGAVAGATAYDVFEIDMINGNLIPLPNSPVTTTSITDTRNLEIGKTYWYTVRTRAGSITGERAVALNYTFTENLPQIVTNENDSGQGSLREAIARACPASTITFASNVREILLNSSLIIEKDLTINGGSGGRTVLIKRNSPTPFRLFRIAKGTQNIAINNITVNMNNLTLQNGGASDFGGAILNTGTLSLRNCFILENSSGGTGGAIMNGFEFRAGTVSLTNCVLASNVSNPENGATLQNGFFSPATMTLINCTITDNQGASDRIGIRNLGSTLTLQNTIINHEGSISNNGGTVTSQGGNITLGSSAFLNQATDLPNTDPRLLVLTPAYCSPAINSGIGTISATDALGNSRIGIGDRGAIEFTGQSPAIQNFIVQNGNDSGAGSLREAITCAPEGASISFANGVNLITLKSSELLIRKNINIIGTNNTHIQRDSEKPFRIFNIENGSSLPVKITHLTIANGLLPSSANSTSSASGGGLRLSKGNLLLENVRIQKNTAPLGGGIAISANTRLDISNSLILNNISNSNNNNTTRFRQIGGGMWIEANGTAYVTNSVIGNNIASNAGAGISNAGTLNLLHATISGNKGNALPSDNESNNNASALDLLENSNTTIQNTILFNPNLLGGNLSVTTPILFTSRGGNLSSDHSTTERLKEVGDQNHVRPFFVDAENNNFDLLCYDAVTPNPAVGKGVKTNAPETDILGRKRQKIDIGAYSLQSCP